MPRRAMPPVRRSRRWKVRHVPSRPGYFEAVGVNNQTIGYLERGDYKPSLELAMKIAQHFGVSVEMLFSFRRFESIAMSLKRAGEDE